MAYDLVIRNGRVISSADDYVADVAVSGERIAAIGHDLRGAREIDATGKYVLPGAIDSHVHMRTDHGTTSFYDDTFETGTIAAAIGGVTTIIDQAQVEAGTTLSDGLDRRLAEAHGAAVVDYTLHMNLREPSYDRVREIPEIARRGVTSFKFFMTYDTYRVPDEIIFASMQAVAGFAGLAVVHAENDAIINELLRQQAEAGIPPDLHSLAAARPAPMEGEAVHRALAMAHVAGTSTLIFHVTARESVRELAAARDRGQTAFGEACLHYLLLGPEAFDVPISGDAFAISPPLRSEEHRDALWRALGDGTLDIVSTDHGPRRRLRHPDGSQTTQPGTSGIEVRLALIHTFGVLRRRLTLNQWVDRCCSRPAELFNLERKGRLVPGFDADIVVFDPKRNVELSARTLHSNIDHSTYEGVTALGFPVTTISRGEEIVRDGAFVGTAGRGRFLERDGRDPSAYRHRRRASQT